MKTKKIKEPELHDIFHGGSDALVFWAFRYFLGRRTAATVCFAEELARAWPILSEGKKALIKREIEDEFVRDEDARLRGLSFRPLGDDCDRAAWQKVRDAYSK